jgi:hypothetical protein
MLQDLRSVHAYHNSTTLIRDIDASSWVSLTSRSSTHRTALIRYRCYRRGHRFSTITTREDHNFDPWHGDGGGILNAPTLYRLLDQSIGAIES